MSTFPYSWLMLCSLLFSATSQANIRVKDSLGEHVLAQTPTRIVALNWDLAEQLLELGVTPLAVANIKDYQTWVVKPAIPDAVQDVGTRTEPNLEKLASLKPDLILIASPQKDLMVRLQTIAPVLYYETYNADQDSAAAAIENFKNIAGVVGKSTRAEQKLNDMKERFRELKQQLNDAYNGHLPSVVAIRFASQTTIYLYTNQSTTAYAIKQLGLTVERPQAAKKWGIVQKRLTELQYVSKGYVIYFDAIDQQNKLDKSMLWKALPFVRNGHVNQAQPVWNYGGAMSIQYIAESITQSLLEIKPQ
ncbi:MAG: ABC-type Fe3+-hydroxamate transport system substrate-binding protein [Psychromonas sp.]|jgi:ABC-type Fe3+-hydroxamate transport system substrate-binding protein|uniref:iron-siderophore ABC transporter substrate-binding protein n=1 Tax=Psychromonas sp. TaxID=1884585 RepID=UPI0039E6F150